MQRQNQNVNIQYCPHYIQPTTFSEGNIYFFINNEEIVFRYAYNIFLMDSYYYDLNSFIATDSNGNLFEDFKIHSIMKNYGERKRYERIQLNFRVIIGLKEKIFNLIHVDLHNNKTNLGSFKWTFNRNELWVNERGYNKDKSIYTFLIRDRYGKLQPCLRFLNFQGVYNQYNHIFKDNQSKSDIYENDIMSFNNEHDNLETRELPRNGNKFYTVSNGKARSLPSSTNYENEKTELVDSIKEILQSTGVNNDMKNLELRGYSHSFEEFDHQTSLYSIFSDNG
ncbi:hypothetical protein NGRA_0274 [Nosema granulosis]|uniref:Uncharacterized protein n=1 Tax=Nosema granulosis TaxID=83296 RepID=A0A9P6H169_9MICR|nr:hypothetical protein NGRA_0274 [Nosema granulosis]